MRISFLIIALSFSSGLFAQSDDHWIESDQSLRGLITSGYEIKGFNTVAVRRVLTHRYLLQKDTSLYMCSDSYSAQGSSVSLSSKCRMLR